MIRKIILLFFCVTLLVSCGKKADPEYKESKYEYINQKNVIEFFLAIPSASRSRRTSTTG